MHLSIFSQLAPVSKWDTVCEICMVGTLMEILVPVYAQCSLILLALSCLILCQMFCRILLSAVACFHNSVKQSQIIIRLHLAACSKLYTVRFILWQNLFHLPLDRPKHKSGFTTGLVNMSFLRFNGTYGKQMSVTLSFFTMYNVHSIQFHGKLRTTNEPPKNKLTRQHREYFVSFFIYINYFCTYSMYDLFII